MAKYRNIGANLNTDNTDDVKRIAAWDAWKAKRRPVDVLRGLIDSAVEWQAEEVSRTDTLTQMASDISEILRILSTSEVRQGIPLSPEDEEHLVSLQDAIQFL